MAPVTAYAAQHKTTFCLANDAIRSRHLGAALRRTASVAWRQAVTGSTHACAAQCQFRLFRATTEQRLRLGGVAAHWRAETPAAPACHTSASY